MPIQEIMKLRTSRDEELKVSLLLAIHCAPVLLGIKAANIVTVTGRELFRIGELLQGTDIFYCFLKTQGDKGILYLYREREIIKYLHSTDIQTFLMEYGYETKDFSKMLEHLGDRIQFYENGETTFPHEIGILLEYPLLDVKGFLENNGENFLYSGYWKVYHDVYNTLRRFEAYDVVREYAVRAVVSGMKIREIAV